MTRKYQPGCACCTDLCRIDRFSEVTQIDGDTIRSTEHPQSPYPAWLQAEVKASIGDTVKLYLAYDDVSAGDGLYVEFTPQSGPTNGTLKLYRKDDTQLGDTLQVLCAEPDLWHLITVCYDPDTDEFTACIDTRDSRGYIVRGQCVTAAVPTGFIAGRKAGYGGSGYVKNYRYERLWYLGTGTESLCCTPALGETQKGKPPGSPPSAQIDGGSTCYGILTFTVRGPYPQNFETVNIVVYMPPSETDLAQLISDLNSAATANEWDVTYSATYVDGVLVITCTPGESINHEDIVSNWIGDFTGCSVTGELDPGSEAGQNEVQSLTLQYTVCAYTLAYEGEQTASLNETSTATEIQAALEALSTVGSGNVSVSGSVGGPFSIEFTGALAATDVDLIVATSDDQNCLDCVLEQEYYGYGYYGTECSRIYCHRCGSPSCTVVDEDFSDIEGDETTPGDMPCGWDADGTNWEVIDGAATGNGPICHEYDTTDGSYVVSATFSLGHLETQGDTLTVTLSYGDIDHSVIVTRIAGPSSGDPDVFKYTFSPSGMGTLVFDDEQTSVSMRICDGHVWNDIANTRLTATKTTEGVCVSITQPTYSGFSDASLTSLTIIKDYSMDPKCPCCTDTCFEGQSAALDTEYNWSLSSGTMINGVIASPGATATWNHQLSERAWEAYSLAIKFESVWEKETASIGDSIVFTSPGISATIAVTQVTPSLTLMLTLSGATGDDTSETISGIFTSISVCVENGMAVVTLGSVYGAAAVVYGTVSSTPISGSVSISVNSPHDFKLVSLLARYTGTITDEDCADKDCGRCTPPCDLCVDADGITALEIDLDWGPVTSDNIASVSNPDGTWITSFSDWPSITFNLYPSFVIPMQTISGTHNCRIEGGLNVYSYELPYGDKCVRVPYITSWYNDFVVPAVWETLYVYGDVIVRYAFAAAFTNNLSLISGPLSTLKFTYDCSSAAGLYLTGIPTPYGHYLQVAIAMTAHSKQTLRTSGLSCDTIYTAGRDGNASTWSVWIQNLGTLPIDCRKTFDNMQLYAGPKDLVTGYIYDGMWKSQGTPRSVICRGI